MKLKSGLIKTLKISVDNKLSRNFGEKWLDYLFASKQRSKNVRQLNIRYDHINIKQHSQVAYLGCVLDEAMSGKPIALKITIQNKWEIKISL